MTMYRYVRDDKRNPIAVIASIGPGMVGWACCCKKDEFNKKLGKEIAEQRALKGIPNKIPDYRMYTNYKGERASLKSAVDYLIAEMTRKSLMLKTQ